MAKEQFSRTKACATKTLYAVMKEMVRRGGSIPAKEIYPWVNENVEEAGFHSFNAKVKAFKAALRGIRDENTFLYTLYDIRLPPLIID